MTWVKVCGLRTENDVAAAVEAGADAVGFVLAADSPRTISAATARRLKPAESVMSVVVTVDFTPQQLMAAVEATGVTGVQPHGRHQEDAARMARGEGLFVLYPVPVKGYVDLENVGEGLMPLLDTYRPGRHGGTGERFAWEVTKSLDRDFVLAGGLDPDSVGNAVREIAPWGVDASSGLEFTRGRKDPGLIRDFVERAKRP